MVAQEHTSTRRLPCATDDDEDKSRPLAPQKKEWGESSRGNFGMDASVDSLLTWVSVASSGSHRVFMTQNLLGEVLWCWDSHGGTTEAPEKACTWLRAISSCSRLTFLPGTAWVLLSKIYNLQTFSGLSVLVG